MCGTVTCVRGPSFSTPSPTSTLEWPPLPFSGLGEEEEREEEEEEEDREEESGEGWWDDGVAWLGLAIFRKEGEEERNGDVEEEREGAGKGCMSACAFSFC